MTTIIITLLICLPIFAFAWIAIHELSHYFVCKFYADITDVEFKLYPHFYEKDGKKSFRVAAVHWKYVDKRPTREQSAVICMAPRFPDLFACIALPFAVFLQPYTIPFVIWLCFFGCGIVDFFYGSIGFSEFSDLKRASKLLDISPNVFRVLSYVTLSISVGLTLALLLT